MKKRIFYMVFVFCIFWNINLSANYNSMKFGHIQFLNKHTGKAQTVKVPINSLYTFDEKLNILIRKCYLSKDQEKVENKGFLQVVKRENIVEGIKLASNILNDIIDIPKEFSKPKKPDEVDLFIFSGWLFSSSPSINYVEDNVYDITLLRCSN